MNKNEPFQREQYHISTNPCPKIAHQFMGVYQYLTPSGSIEQKCVKTEKSQCFAYFYLREQLKKINTIKLVLKQTDFFRCQYRTMPFIHAQRYSFSRRFGKCK